MTAQQVPEKIALFSPFSGHLELLFGFIDNGDLGLPDIQRPFVWKDVTVRGLFDSIYRGYPIGSYLFWKNSIGVKARHIGTTRKQHEDPTWLIIDGQQRLTALYAVFRNQKVKDEHYEDRRIIIAFNPVTEQFKVADATTEQNPEYISNISEFMTRPAAVAFINGYLKQLSKYYTELSAKQSVVRSKIEKGAELSKQDIELIADKIKGQVAISDEEMAILEKLEKKPLEKDIEDEGGDEKTEGNGEDNEDDQSILGKSEEFLLLNLLDKQEVVDEELISARLEKLYNLKNYPFNALEIVPNLGEEQVAEIFTRINSKGTVLKQADFILTLLSVFWQKGREKIDDFCRLAKKVPAKDSAPSPFNYIFEPSPTDLIRVIVGLGFGRGKMKDAYSILSGRDFTTQKVSTKLREKQFETFKGAQKSALDLTNWHEFLKILQWLGYRSEALISSANNIANAYILFLMAKEKVGLEHKELQKHIGKWFFFSSITSRYSFSPESQMESDLNAFRARDKKEFLATLSHMIANEITNDFWEITVPNKLLVSSSMKNALRNAFFASLIRSSANVFASVRKVADLFDPSLKPKRKSLEKHHLFPKNYLSGLGLDRRQINQVANFTYIEYADNVDISDDPPRVYFKSIRKDHKPEVLASMMRAHCLPEKFYEMKYEDFLVARRKLIAKAVRETFESL